MNRLPKYVHLLEGMMLYYGQMKQVSKKKLNDKFGIPLKNSLQRDLDLLF